MKSERFNNSMVDFFDKAIYMFFCGLILSTVILVVFLTATGAVSVTRELDKEPIKINLLDSNKKLIKQLDGQVYSTPGKYSTIKSIEVTVK